MVGPELRQPGIFDPEQPVAADAPPRSGSSRSPAVASDGSSGAQVVPSAGTVPATRYAVTAASMQSLPRPTMVWPSPSKVRRCPESNVSARACASSIGVNGSPTSPTTRIGGAPLPSMSWSGCATGVGQNAQGRPSMRSMVSKRDAMPNPRTFARASRRVRSAAELDATDRRVRFELVVVRAVLPAARVAVAEREERRTVALRRVRQRVHEAGPLVLAAVDRLDHAELGESTTERAGPTAMGVSWSASIRVS